MRQPKARESVRKEKIAVLLTMTDFYRRRRPQLSTDLFTRWKKRIEEALSDDLDLYFPVMVHTDEEYKQAVSSAQAKGCDLILLLPVAYASSGAAETALSAACIPLLVVSSAWDFIIPEDADSDVLRINQAVHGVQDITNVLRRAKRPFYIEAGHFSDKEFILKLKRACRAGAAASLFYSGRSGQIGGELEGMLDFSYSIGSRPPLLRFEKVLLKPDELVRHAGKVEEGRIDEYRKWMQNYFSVPRDITREELGVNARYALGLEDLVRKNDLDAVALNFSALIEGGCRTLPFLGTSKMLSDGIGYGGEGDTLTALLNSVLYRITPLTTFSEFFSSDFGKNEILLSHMGECNIALTAEKPIPLKMRSFPWGDVIRPAVPVFQMEPGRVSICSISELPGKGGFQLLVLRGEVTASPQYPRLDVPYTKVRFDKDLGEVLKQYSLSGGTHHVVLSYGDISKDVQLLAGCCGMEYREV